MWSDGVEANNKNESFNIRGTNSDNRVETKDKESCITYELFIHKSLS